MDNIALKAGEDTLLSFNVDIAGTSQKAASVQVILEKDGVKLGFSAEQQGEGNTFISAIKNPDVLFGEGEVRLSIQVLLNNRLFVPMKTTAMIQAAVPEVSVQLVNPVLEPVSKSPELVPEVKSSSLLKSIEGPTKVIKKETVKPVSINSTVSEDSLFILKRLQVVTR